MRNRSGCLVFKCCLALISVTHTWFHGDWFLSDDTIEVGGGGALAQLTIGMFCAISNGKRKVTMVFAGAIYFFANTKLFQSR